MFGQHYENCIWAYDYSVYGFDECECWAVESYLKEVKKIADFYKQHADRTSDNDIENFLEEYSDLLLDEHRTTLEKHHSFLKKYRTMEQRHTQYGVHYICCCWAHPGATPGPDTCECIDIIRVTKEMIRLMNFYKRFKNK